MSADSPRVESFVLRFVQDAPEKRASNWHAVIVHVQSNEEKTCTDFADAVAFIARYVPLGNFVFPPTADDRPPTAESRQPSAVSGQS
ncbi:MAG: hypothetical protein AB1817_21240 [Chloroflexota bacterium]